MRWCVVFVALLIGCGSSRSSGSSSGSALPVSVLSITGRSISVGPLPPTNSFSVTFVNRGSIAFQANDPTVGVQLSFADASNPSQVTVTIAPLSQTLPALGSADEAVVVSSMPTLVNVTASLVSLDAVGRVVSQISPAFSITITPTIIEGT
jgi:hypothetical protein